ncbi:Ribophorin I [Hesseltinella vesiculosa]|uniref:Dolichyl-diphosphooligosaccharide--protein glycosyltransferase subunit 1 n=1 Tax=Hesseltinella vesiculosa TaxID=101127 RepID=A0A1X2GKG4_9FUNG|nr:Ribophorin I [Hesseltinella vesiculosa]
MLRWFLAMALLSMSMVLASSVPSNALFNNNKVLRVIDMRSSIVREDVGIRAENIGDVPADAYYYAVPKVINDKVAHVEGFLREEPKSSLKVESVGFDDENQAQLYKVLLPAPLAPKKEIRIGIKIVYTHAVSPLPEKLPQMSRQFVQYEGAIFFFTPYETVEQKTTLQLPPGQLASYTSSSNLVEHKGNKLIHGPFINMNAYRYEPLRAHFEFSAALLTVTALERELFVSHWNNVLSVEEQYYLQNDGAKLASHFNRVQHMLTQQYHAATNMIKELTLRFPASARDAYFRDEIGNVSTSHFRQERDATVMEIKPRFPLFGGWLYNWYHGYNAKLDDFLRYDADSGKYILSIQFIDNAKTMAIDKATVKIVLPEGVSDVQVKAPFALDREEHTKYFSNFDTTGRHMITLEKHNLVHEHEQLLEVRRARLAGR